MLLDRTRSAQPVVDLTTSNPTVAIADYPHSAIASAFRFVKTFAYAPNPLGSIGSRSLIAEYYSRRRVQLSAEHIALTASTSEAYSQLFQLFCDPGDQVLVPTPSYPLFEYLASLSCVDLVQYRLAYDGAWHIDLDHLASQIGARTRAVVIVDPNNPTGSYLKSEEASGLSALLHQADLPLIVDEVFVDYPLASVGTANPIAIDPDCLVLRLNGLSKLCGMPQLKLAWIAITGTHEALQQTRSRLELIGDTYLSVSTPVQSALPALFAVGNKIRASIQQQLESNLVVLDRELDQLPVSRLRLEGGWSAILRLPAILDSGCDWAEHLLLKHGVLVQPGYFFELDSQNQIVVSLLTPPAPFRIGIANIAHAITTLG